MVSSKRIVDWFSPGRDFHGREGVGDASRSAAWRLIAVVRDRNVFKWRQPNTMETLAAAICPFLVGDIFPPQLTFMPAKLIALSLPAANSWIMRF